MHLALAFHVVLHHHHPLHNAGSATWYSECPADGNGVICAAPRASFGTKLVSKVVKLNQKWLLTCGWLWYNLVRVLMWCASCCEHPLLECSIPFLQCASNLTVFSLNKTWQIWHLPRVFCLWKSGGRVTSVTHTLPTEVQDGILALFCAMYKIMQSDQHMTNFEGDAELVLPNEGTKVPNYHCRPFGIALLCFTHTVKTYQFSSTASDSCMDRT